MEGLGKHVVFPSFPLRIRQYSRCYFCHSFWYEFLVYQFLQGCLRKTESYIFILIQAVTDLTTANHGYHALCSPEQLNSVVQNINPLDCYYIFNPLLKILIIYVLSTYKRNSVTRGPFFKIILGLKVSLLMVTYQFVKIWTPKVKNTIGIVGYGTISCLEK